LKPFRDVCRAHVVVDVRVLRGEGRLVQLKGENWSDSLHGVDGVSFKPTTAAVELMLKSSGFRDVRLIPPQPDDQGAYAEGRRALFTARIRVREEDPEKSAAPRGSAVKPGLGA